MNQIFEAIMRLADIASELKVYLYVLVGTQIIPTAAVLTLPVLESFVIIGITFAAWIKILGAIQLLLVVLLNLVKVIQVIREKFKKRKDKL